MIKRYLVIIALLLTGEKAVAQSTIDYSIQLSATTNINPPQVILHWDSIAYATSYQIFKKPKLAASWGPAMAFLNGGDTMYVDNAVIVDSSYEYKMVALGVQQAYGYIHAGIEAPAIHKRGAIVLLVDDFFLPNLAGQIDQVVRDLAGDGWEVIRHDVSRATPDASIRSMLILDRLGNPRINAVYILGHVAVPYSGYIYPDGHYPDHAGAWPADVYYADLDGIWSDINVNDANATRTQNHNIPGDGKWDQNFIPSATEVQIGRLDFYDMPVFNKTEEQMMSSYLTRAHKFKVDSVNIAKRALIDDNFGGFGGEAFGANGFRMFRGMVGPDKVYQIDLVNSLDDSSFLFAYGCGAGSYTSAAGVGVTGDFVNNAADAIFVGLFGSYFGDWDSQNNFLRAPLCSDVPALATYWGGRPNWFIHHMALGENIGFSARLTQNNNTLYTPGNFGTRYVHIALMGDPSLRTEYIKPPKNVTVNQIDATSTYLNWVQSPDSAVLGYYVYRATSRYGDYQLVSPLLTNHNFSDLNVPSGTYYYKVRAMKPETTGSGGYDNLSLGAISDSVIVDNNLSVAKLFTSNGFVVYPNPAKDRVNVRFTYGSTADANIRLVDVTGKEVYSSTQALHLGANEVSIDVSSMPAGIYAVLVQTADGTVSQKVLVNRD